MIITVTIVAEMSIYSSERSVSDSITGINGSDECGGSADSSGSPWEIVKVVSWYMKSARKYYGDRERAWWRVW